MNPRRLERVMTRVCVPQTRSANTKCVWHPTQPKEGIRLGGNGHCGHTDVRLHGHCRTCGIITATSDITNSACFFGINEERGRGWLDGSISRVSNSEPWLRWVIGNWEASIFDGRDLDSAVARKGRRRRNRTRVATTTTAAVIVRNFKWRGRLRQGRIKDEKINTSIVTRLTNDFYLIYPWTSSRLAWFSSSNDGLWQRRPW